MESDAKREWKTKTRAAGAEQSGERESGRCNCYGKRCAYLGERFTDHVAKHGSLFAGPPRLDSGRDFDFGQS